MFKTLCIGLFLSLVFASSANAIEPKTACLERQDMVNVLIAEYEEYLVEVRKVKGKGLLEFHVNEEDGTWTALLTDEYYWSCVLKVGEGITIQANFKKIKI